MVLASLVVYDVTNPTAFGVLNFLTLFLHTKSRRYLTLANRLIHRVHSVLGYTRDGTAPLPGASPEHPLRGGLRIGKEAATGSDCDGQYHHYLTLWMFALNRYGRFSGQIAFNKLAIELAKAIHPAFVRDFKSGKPGKYMVWKVSEDLKEVLVSSAGRLDPLTGWVVYGILNMNGALDKEIRDYREIYMAKMNSIDEAVGSQDFLDLGMTLWISSWMTREEGGDDIRETALQALKGIEEDGGLGLGAGHRIAFREFGAVMGLKCCWESQGAYWQMWIRQVMEAWEEEELVPTPKGNVPELPKLGKVSPITGVMYCAAINPGGKFARQRSFVDCS
jgi:hypothetical protein